MLKTKSYTKKQLAEELGISYGMLYYKHKRIALELKIGKNRALRVMKKYGIEPIKRRSKKFSKPEDTGHPPVNIPNLLQETAVTKPGVAWVGCIS